MGYIVSKVPLRVSLLGGGTDVGDINDKKCWRADFIGFSIDKYIYISSTSYPKFLDKKKSLGYTNNPKYFVKRIENNNQKKDKKNHSFKGKKKFKNRKRPKNFSFKKFKR